MGLWLLTSRWPCGLLAVGGRRLRQWWGRLLGWWGLGLRWRGWGRLCHGGLLCLLLVSQCLWSVKGRTVGRAEPPPWTPSPGLATTPFSLWRCAQHEERPPEWEAAACRS